ncbi:MAG: hypothetical protein AAFN18_22720 [Cyanobacteria bacterium J06554_6]
MLMVLADWPEDAERKLKPRRRNTTVCLSIELPERTAAAFKYLVELGHLDYDQAADAAFCSWIEQQLQQEQAGRSAAGGEG